MAKILYSLMFTPLLSVVHFQLLGAACVKKISISQLFPDTCAPLVSIYQLLPAARTALITIFPLISDTGAPLEQSHTTLLKPCSMGP